MKRTFFLLATALLSFAATTNIFALEKNIKMGKPTNEELTMTTYDADPDAEAVCLYHSTYVSFRLSADGLKVDYENKVRIKVLKPEAVDRGNVEVVYYRSDKNTNKENVNGVKGFAYNLENGKVVKSKLNSDLKSDEEVNSRYHRFKFTIPNVKVGTVIEYEYTITSDFYWEVRDWYAQWSIPVKYAEYTIVAPSFLKFKKACTGIYSLQSKFTDATFSYSDQYGTGSLAATKETYWAEDLPKMVKEDYIHYIDDYKTHVVYDLQALDFPGRAPRLFNNTWEDVDKLLREDEVFGELFKMKNPMPELGVYLKGINEVNLKKEAKQAQTVTDDEGKESKIMSFEVLDLEGKSIKEKVTLMRKAMLNRIKWNDGYGIYGKSARQVIKDRSGDGGDLCFTLMAFLNEAGINAEPVVLSRRSRGRLNIAHPAINSYNTLVLQVKDGENVFYVDATSADYPVGTLPADMLVTEGRLIQKKGGAMWVDLSKSGKATSQFFTSAEINDEGTLSGLAVRRFGGLLSGSFRRGYHNKKDSLTYVEALASRLDAEITDYRVGDLSIKSENSIDSISFTKSLESDGETIYLNPFLFVDMKTPFKSDTRVLPIECDCPVSEKYNIQIKLPEGYTIEEMPKPVQVRMEDGKTSCRIIPGVNNGMLSIAINYTRNTVFYSADQFPTLRTFWSTIEDCCNSVIVLKKAQ